MSGELWLTILSAVLTLALAAFGGYFARLKREVGEFFKVLNEALADGEVTPDEIRAVLVEARGVREAVQELIGLLLAKSPRYRARRHI